MRKSQKHKIVRTGGQRIAFTNTTKIPDAEIRAALKFCAKEIDMDGVVAHFKKAGDFRRTWGRAYPYIPDITNMNGLNRWEWKYLIVVTDHGHDHLSLGMMDTLGHEAKHVEQYRRGTIRREKKNRNCEAQCRAFGGWLARQWKEALEAA